MQAVTDSFLPAVVTKLQIIDICVFQSPLWTYIPFIFRAIVITFAIGLNVAYIFKDGRIFFAIASQYAIGTHPHSKALLDTLRIVIIVFVFNNDAIGPALAYIVNAGVTWLAITS